MSLRQQSIVAVGSSAALSLVGDVARLGTMIALARLLMPEDYGTPVLRSPCCSGWVRLASRTSRRTFCAIAGEGQMARIFSSD